MKNFDIYKNALRLLAQSVDEDENADLAERAPYFIAAFCCEAAELDRAARLVLGIEGPEEFNEVCLALDEDFPLLPRFATVAAKYLAAMLVIEEDGDLSDKLYAMYCDGMSLIKEGLPALIEKIVHKKP
ncbi:MAG: hypothetical protein IJ011_05520 [Clostridia bacterium]|nr:hypothetical protein [Clostridia bacterium]